MRCASRVEDAGRRHRFHHHHFPRPVSKGQILNVAATVVAGRSAVVEAMLAGAIVGTAAATAAAAIPTVTAFQRDRTDQQSPKCSQSLNRLLVCTLCLPGVSIFQSPA